MTRVAVIGGGVTGVTTAYELAQRGVQVLLIEREKDLACGASHSNGAQLSYSYVAPLAAPGVPLQALKYMVQRSAPLSFTPRLDSKQWSWVFAFLRACNSEHSLDTTVRLLHLSTASRRAMHRLVDSHRLDFHYSRTGKLVLYRSAGSLAKAKNQAAIQNAHGHQQQVLDANECRKLEPGLAAALETVIGGIYASDDETGDCRLFTQQLAQLVPRMQGGSRVLLGTAVTAIEVSGDRATTVRTTAGNFGVDAIVVAAGNSASELCRRLGIDLPIYPLKGYSTTTALGTANRLRVSVTDFDRKMVFAPLGSSIRTAGFVELGRRSLGVSGSRVRMLRNATASILDLRAPAQQPWHSWAGCRPATPSGRPIIGASPIRNLYLNTGHGALGFTLAMGSAQLVADALLGVGNELSKHFSLRNAQHSPERSDTTI